MPKTKPAKKTTHSQKRSSEKPAINLDDLVDRYIWLLVPILVIVYYWFSTGSSGFYQDDEIGHYRNIRGFWGDPFSIMGNQPKPGWKILMVLPGLLGFTGVALAHCLVAALTVVFTYKLGRAMGWKNSIVGAVLLAFQPLYLQLAFRSYSEITAGLFVVLMIWWYYKGWFVPAALASSYIFTIRQEFALVSIGLGILFLVKKKWLPFILLGAAPLVLGLIGWAHTGNMMWLIDDMRRIGLGVEVPHKPFWHYFETFIYIAGPVCLALFVAGYWSFLSPPVKWRENLTEHGFLFFTFTIMWAWAVVSAWDVLNFGANPGHWRYLLSITPLVAVYSVKGLNVLSDVAQRKYGLLVLGAFTLIVLVFLSREANGLTMLETASYTNFGVAAGIFLLFLLHAYARVPGAAAFGVILAILAVVVTFATEKPRKLDTEASTVKDAAKWYLAQPADIQHRPLYCNHVLFRYFADIDINDRNRDRSVRKADLAKAPKGSLIVWDSHYGNSQFGGDVPYEYFQNNPDYTMLNQLVAPDQRFGALVFEKVR